MAEEITVKMPNEPEKAPDVPVVQVPQTNRAQRRRKGTKIGIHHMRAWQARTIVDKLFTPKPPHP